MSRVAGQERGPTIWWSQAKWHLVWQKSPVFAEKPQAICSTALSSSAFWNNYLPSFSGTVLALAIPARIHVDHVEQCFHQGPTVSGKVWKNLWSFSQLGKVWKKFCLLVSKKIHRLDLFTCIFIMFYSRLIILLPTCLTIILPAVELDISFEKDSVWQRSGNLLSELRRNHVSLKLKPSSFFFHCMTSTSVTASPPAGAEKSWHKLCVKDHKTFCLNF